MGLIPNTGTEISMGRIAKALGLAAAYPPTGADQNITLNAKLGTGRNRSLSGVASIATGSLTRESTDFGGLQTPFDY